METCPSDACYLKKSVDLHTWLLANISWEGGGNQTFFFLTSSAGLNPAVFCRKSFLYRKCHAFCQPIQLNSSPNRQLFLSFFSPFLRNFSESAIC